MSQADLDRMIGITKFLHPIQPLRQGEILYARDLGGDASRGRMNLANIPTLEHYKLTYTCLVAPKTRFNSQDLENFGTHRRLTSTFTFFNLFHSARLHQSISISIACFATYIFVCTTSAVYALFRSIMSHLIVGIFTFCQFSDLSNSNNRNAHLALLSIT